MVKGKGQKNTTQALNQTGVRSCSNLDFVVSRLSNSIDEKAEPNCKPKCHFPSTRTLFIVNLKGFTEFSPLDDIAGQVAVVSLGSSETLTLVNLVQSLNFHLFHRPALVLLLVEDEQVDDDEEGEWDERVVVEEGPQEGKAAHLQMSIQIT